MAVPLPILPPGCFPIIRVVALATRQQALQQKTRPALLLPEPLLILLQLRLAGRKHRRRNQRRHRDGNLLLRGHFFCRDRPAGLQGLATLGAEAVVERLGAPASERRLPDIGGVLEHAPHRRPVPPALALRVGMPAASKRR